MFSIVSICANDWETLRHITDIKLNKMYSTGVRDTAIEYAIYGENEEMVHLSMYSLKLFSDGNQKRFRYLHCDVNVIHNTRNFELK